MRHELLTQHALFCIGVNAKKGTLSQHLVTPAIPLLAHTPREVDSVAWWEYQGFIKSVIASRARLSPSFYSQEDSRRSGGGHLMGRDGSPQYQHQPNSRRDSHAAEFLEGQEVRGWPPHGEGWFPPISASTQLQEGQQCS